MEKVKLKYAFLSLVVAVVSYLLPLGLEESPHRMLFVMVFVAMLWITESVPLHATAILAAFLMITIIGLKPSEVFAQYFDPVIVLLLGGFAIAVAMHEYHLDEYIAYRIISKAGTNSKMVVLAIMATSCAISMWISNSATAAIVMPIALVVLAKNKVKRGVSNFGKACVLAAGFGATIGGIGTIVGSTPNVIAAKFLHDNGISFGFWEWFYRGFPFMLALMIAAWLVLITIFKPEKKTITALRHIKNNKINRQQKKILAIFLLTVALWITESLHGINNGVVALIPIILFYFTGIMSTDDFLKIDWPTLILLGGALAIGFGIHSTGLDSTISSVISSATGGQSILVLFLILGIFGVLMTIFISNTTAAAVYLPIVVVLVSAFGAGMTNAVVIAAIGVSLDFIFPFGTPPTAIAYGTRYVNTRDIMKAGILISILGVLILAAMGLFW